MSEPVGLPTLARFPYISSEVAHESPDDRAGKGLQREALLGPGVGLASSLLGHHACLSLGPPTTVVLKVWQKVRTEEKLGQRVNQRQMRDGHPPIRSLSDCLENTLGK